MQQRSAHRPSAPPSPPSATPKRLRALLAASAGALAATTDAAGAIIHFDPADPVVGFGGSDLDHYDLDLPGGVDARFERAVSTSAGGDIYRLVRFRGTPSLFSSRVQVKGYASAGTRGQDFAVSAAWGATWQTIPDPTVTGTGVPTSASDLQFANVGIRIEATDGNQVLGPNWVTNPYLAFRFDPNNSGQHLYGWVRLSLEIGLGTDPRVTIREWAYDDSGAAIPMGAVPEPRHAALAVGAALMLGAAGVRAWRRRRSAGSAEQAGDSGHGVARKKRLHSDDATETC